jgi:hypothetical protein
MPNLSLLRSSPVNYPSLCNILFCPERLVEIITPYFAASKVSDINTTIHPGDEAASEFYRMYFTPETEEIQAECSDGYTHRIAATFFFPSDNDTISDWINKVIDDKHIVIYVDQMQRIKIIGDTRNGCALAYKFVNRPGKRGYEFTFKVNQQFPIREVAGSFPFEGTIPGLEGIGYWIIEDDFVVQ